MLNVATAQTTDINIEILICHHNSSKEQLSYKIINQTIIKFASLRLQLCNNMRSTLNTIDSRYLEGTL